MEILLKKEPVSDIRSIFQTSFDLRTFADIHMYTFGTGVVESYLDIKITSLPSIDTIPVDIRFRDTGSLPHLSLGRQVEKSFSLEYSRRYRSISGNF